VIHDGPFVVHGSPGATTGCHFENHTAKRPDVDGTVATGGAASDDFRGHVHGSASHGALAALSSVGSKGSTLSGDKFCGAKVDVFDYTIVIEENV
jgi:hypothetical protein